MAAIVRVQPEFLHNRLDVRYNSPSAVSARVAIVNSGIKTQSVDQILDLVCGPFGSTLTADEHCDDGEVLLIQPTNLSGDLFSEDKSWRISTKDLIEKGLKLYPEGTLLFARVGIYPHTGVLPNGCGPATISSSMIAGTPISPVDTHYLSIFFQSAIGYRLLLAAQKVTAQPTIGTSEIGSTIVPLPQELAQKYIGDKVRQAERLRAWAKSLEQQFSRALQLHTEDAFEDKSTGRKYNFAKKSDISYTLNPGAFDEERLRVQRQVKANGGVVLGSIATISGQTTSDYSSETTYIGLDAISSNSCQLLPTTVGEADVSGSSRLLPEGPVIAKLRPYLNKVSYIPSFLAGAVGSTELMCVQPTGNVSGWYLYGVLKSELALKQLRPVATGATHPRIDQYDVLNLVVPVLENQEELGEKLQLAQEAYFTAKSYVQAAKLLVEELIEGTLTEQQLVDAQKAVEADDTSLDRDILARLTTKGLDGDGDPLFSDLDQLYDLLAQSQSLDE